MSFTAGVKQELNRVSRQRSCCRTAELSALFRAAGAFHILGRERYGLHSSFNLAASARTAISLVKSFDLPVEVRVREERRLGPHRRYEIHLEGGARLVQFLNEIGVLSTSMSLEHGIPGRIISRPCCRTAFLRGAFIAAGSVSSPGAAAHLEIYSGNGEFLAVTQEVASQLGIALAMKQSGRDAGEPEAVYTKSLQAIRDFLAVTGAHQAALEFEERSILSRVREEANRRANFDQANAARCSQAAARQIEAIRKLEASGVLDSLPSGLKEMAALRLAHPSDTITELGNRASPRLSKSAVNHRLRRLLTLARH